VKLRWRRTEPVKNKILLFQFKPGYYHTWIFGYWGHGMIWGEDEGQYKGMGSEATDNLLRWIPLDEAIKALMESPEESTP
jgi:hypothetical protein